MRKFSRGKALFDLIKSLQPKEIQHFKRYTSGFQKDGGSLYYLVFEYMHQQPEWSEQALRDMLAQKGLAVQLNVAYNYLLKKIQASLRQYDVNSSFQLQARLYLDNVALLFDRKQYGYCRLALKEAGEYAMQLDLPQMELQLVNWEFRLLRMEKIQESWEQIANVAEKGRKLEHDIRIENSLQACYSRIFALVNWPSSAVPGDRQAILRAISEDPILDQNPKQLRFDSALLFYNIRGLIAREQGDKQGYHEANLQKVKLWKRCGQRKQMEPQRYFSALFSSVESALEISRFESAENQIKEIEAFLKDRKGLQREKELLVLHLELRLYLSWQKLEEAMARCTRIPVSSAIQREKLPDHYLELCVNAAHVYFMAGIWSHCLLFLKLAGSSNKNGARLEFTLKAGPLRLMAMYMAQDDGLKRALNEWSRSMGKEDFGALVSSTFGILCTYPDEETERAALLELQAGLDRISVDEGVRRLMRNWTLARLQGRPMRDFYPDAQS